MSLLSMEGANAAAPIQILREIAVPDSKGLDSLALSRASDNGYLLATKYQLIKLDKQGHKAWSYKAEREMSFTDIAATADGGAVACGYRLIRTTDNSPWKFSGMVFRLDREGRLISERELLPSSDIFPAPAGLIFGSRLSRCLSWGKGFAAIGETKEFFNAPGRPSAEGKVKAHYWLVFLTENGEPTGERLYDQPGGSGGVVYSHARVLPNGDLLYADKAGFKRTNILQIAPDGQLRASHGLTDDYRLVDGDIKEAGILLYAQQQGLVRLSPDLQHEQLASAAFANEEMPIEGGAQVLSDGSLAVFGDFPKPTPVFLGGGWRSRVARFYPATGKTAYVDLKPGVNLNVFLLTENPDEFITVRAVIPSDPLPAAIENAAKGPYSGLVIAFIKFRH